MPGSYPERIVCLTEETTETLYLLGEDRRIVGISGFTVRPPRARREKPRVSAFTSAKIDRIRDLKPDLVLGFSDLQADIAAELARAGIEVHLFNHRSVAEILRMIRMLGGMIGCEAKAAALADRLAAGVDEVRAAARAPAAPAARLLRGMGRAADRRDPLGRRTDRDRGRRQLLCGACGDVARPRPHHRGSDGSRAPRARHHLRLLVRQEIPAGARGGAARLGSGARRSATASSTRSSPRSSCSRDRRALTDGLAEIHAHIRRWAGKFTARQAAFGFAVFLDRARDHLRRQAAARERACPSRVSRGSRARIACRTKAG